jgi:hypothetical protein
MMNWKGCERKRSWSNSSFHLGICQQDWENPRKPQSGQPVFGLRFEPWTSRIRIRNANHSTATFGESFRSWKSLSWTRNSSPWMESGIYYRVRKCPPLRLILILSFRLRIPLYKLIKAFNTVSAALDAFQLLETLGVSFGKCPREPH